MKNLWKKIRNAINSFKRLDAKSKSLIMIITMMIIIIILSVSELIHNMKREKENLLPKEERVLVETFDNSLSEDSNVQ